MSVLPSGDGIPGTIICRGPQRLEVVVVSTPPTPPDPGDPWNHDEDPTGIQRLLRSLPDPGPAPPALVDRINASLAAEQAARAGEDRTIVPLRRRRVRTVGLVAAAAAIIAVGVPALVTGSGPGELTAFLRGDTAESAASGSAGTGPESSVTGPVKQTNSEVGPAQGSDDRAASPTGPLRVYLSETAYTSADFPTQAGAFRDNPGGSLRTLAAEAPGIGPMGTETGLRPCLRALGVEPSNPVIADLATFDGRPAVIFVISTDTGQSALAVARPCQPGQVEQLAEVDPLP